MTEQALSTSGLQINQPRLHSIAVWELTLACNLKCRHCGSTAGQARKDELSTAQALDVVKKLKDLGIREVNLIGGEATLRPDWALIGQAITDAGMSLAFQTGGLHINADVIQQMVDINTQTLGVSIDGVGAVHDDQRGIPGSYERALQTLELASLSSIPTLACTTQINRRSYTTVLRLLERVAQTRVKSWQIAQTLPMGIGTSAIDLHLQPADFAVIHELTAIFSVEAWRRGIFAIAANPLGYFGPYERLIRSGPHNMNRLYAGCPAARGAIGIEADGSIKGCPSLPTDPFALGKSTGDGFERLQQVWKDPNSSYQWRVHGFCSRCPFSSTCWSGCGWSSTTTMGEKGDNPYCMFRSIVHNAKGQHERLKQSSHGTLQPFAYGQHELELHDGPDPQVISMDEVEVPDSMKATAQAFRSMRHHVKQTSREVFDSFQHSESATQEQCLSAFSVMERLSLPVDHLMGLGLLGG